MRRSLTLCVLVGLAGGLGLAGGCSPPELPLAETTAELVAVSATNGGNFGSIQVGTSATTMMRVYPQGVGQSSDVISQITESCANFSLTADGLPAEVSKICIREGEIPRVAGEDPVETAAPICDGYEIVDYFFQASFSPTIAGTQSCVITVVLGGETKMYTLTGTGLPPPKEIDLSRTSIAFGDVRVNTASTAQDVVVYSTGSDPLTVSAVSIGGAGAARFLLTGSPTTIPAGSSATYRVTCQPNAVGALTATLTIASDDADESSLTLPLTCAGVDSALSVSPSPIAVMDARVDEPREQLVTLRNEGGATMSLTSVTIAGKDLEIVGTPPSGNIAPGASMQVRVRFLASAAATVSGMLTVRFDSQTQSVTVSAQAKQASMGLHPDGELDFGPICVGRSVPRDVRITAVGAAPFNVGSTRTVGAGFSITAGGGALSFAGNGDFKAVTLTAAPVAPGPMTGSFRVATNIPGGTERTVNLTASAIASGVGVSPAELDFGSLLVDEPTENQRFTIANCGDATLTISDVTVEGPNASDFRVAERPELSSLPVAETTVFRVYMLPRTPGTKNATLVVTHSAGRTEIPITGDGFLPPQPAADKITYYSCTTSDLGRGSSVLALLGLGAVLALRRRRRR